MDNNSFDGMSLFEIFKMESTEHVQTLNRLLLDLEKSPTDLEIIDEIMRTAHTLKGASRIVNNTDIQSIAHGMESLFVRFKENKMKVNSDYIDLMFEALDSITSIVEALSSAKSHNVDIINLAQRLKIAEAGETVITKNKAKEKTSCESQSTGQEKIPEKDRRQNDNQASLVERKIIADKVLAQKQSGEQTVRVDITRLDKLLNLCGELYVASVRLDNQREGIREILQSFIELSGSMDRLHGLLGENKNSINEIVDSVIDKNRQVTNSLTKKILSFYEILETLGINFLYLTKDLQDQLMQSRMLSVSTIFEPNLRFIRDWSRETGKKIKLHILGGDTLIDRRVSETIKDPLMHLVRNACDHGIETSDVRRSQHKPEEGNIYLRAYNRGDRIIVEVEDDGAGIDVELVKKKIVEKHYLIEAEAERLSREELLNFLFLPGFSTANVISSTSGRGVGLDVVKMNLDKIQGSIKIDTEPNRFARFAMSLPLTLAVNKCLLVKVGANTLAILLTQVEEVIIIDKKEIKTIESKESLNYQGQIISLVNLGNLLGLANEATFSSDTIAVVIVGLHDGKVGLAVDSLVGEKEVVVKSLDERLGKIRDISAATILDDGEIALILDIGDVLRSVKDYTGKAVFTRMQEAKITKRRTILIVDDSFTVRELQKKVIMNAGYNVDTASNGEEGLMKTKETVYDLIITDIDMPKLNGLDFIKLVKQNEKTKDIPIIIVSYKEREEDKRMGMKLGASRYIVKSEYENKTILDAVYQLIG